MVTSLFRVGQSVLMRAKAGERAARQRTIRIILALTVSRGESGSVGSPGLLS